MKLITLTLVVSFLLITNINSQTVGLKDIVQKRTSEFPANVKANQFGGNVTFKRTYRTNCIGTYNIVWQFDKDISTLQNGEEFTITISCKNCKTDCGFRWKIANVYAANNVTKIEQYPNYTYNGNISQLSTSASASGVHDWYPGHSSHSYTFVYNKKKTAPLTAFYFDFAGHQVYYVFEEGFSPSKTVNCHTLFGLGKLIYGLELGAYEAYNWEWMDTTIGYALEHIKSSNCLTDDYLKDLKNRMYKSTNTTQFLDEIRLYSRKLDTEISTSCGCCASCNN